ncbi:MAG TPA: hypothetical protein VFR47_21350 [Anaerolineales bacterium]|nr:hypothetical protein [Anaerolineales bacterium]
MQTSASSPQAMPVSRPATATISHPWLMLISRSVLFLTFQALIALIFAAAGNASAWDESARWWMFVGIFTNIASVYLLVRLFKAEGKRYFEVIRFSRATFKTDLLWFFVASLIGLPIAAALKDPLAIALFGDAMTPTYMLFRPLPTWAFVLSFLFPLTIAFAELPNYFAYVMPRLETQLKNGWGSWFIASFFLAAQHMFLPLILDGSFMLWRSGMFLPFALFTGLVLKIRPSLLPYFMVIHALLDITTVLVYLMI